MVVAETTDDAKREIATADAAYGTLPADILSRAGTYGGFNHLRPRRQPDTTIPTSSRNW